MTEDAVVDDVVDELVAMLRRTYNYLELHYVAGSDDLTEEVLEDARLLLGRHGVEV